MLLVFRQSLATPETMLPFKIVTTRSTHFITTPAVVASSIINIIIVFLIVIIVATSMTPSASGLASQASVACSHARQCSTAWLRADAENFDSSQRVQGLGSRAWGLGFRAFRVLR